MITISSNLVFACYDASCRPPTSGGTGGSLKVQHVTRRGRSGSIQREGLQPQRERGFGKVHGDGVYFSTRGDEKSRKYYARIANEGKRNNHDVVKANVRLSNPIKVTGKNLWEIRSQVAEQLGGQQRVAELAGAKYKKMADKARNIITEELAKDNPKAFSDLDLTYPERAFFGYGKFSKPSLDRVYDRLHKEGASDLDAMGYLRVLAENPGEVFKNPKGASDQNTHFNRIIANMAKDEGHDGIIIETRAWGIVGGPQIVVFDPKKIRLVRPLP